MSGKKNKLRHSMYSTQSPQVKAVLKARDLILLALENADSTTLQYLIGLQETMCNLNFARLLEEIEKREENRDA
jgi:hypothetical protein